MSHRVSEVIVKKIAKDNYQINIVGGEKYTPEKERMTTYDLSRFVVALSNQHPEVVLNEVGSYFSFYLIETEVAGDMTIEDLFSEIDNENNPKITAKKRSIISRVLSIFKKKNHG